VVATGTAHIGIVRRDALLVEEVGRPTLVATYERDEPEAVDFDAGNALEAASEAYGLDFEHAVCAVGVEVSEKGVGFAVENGG
jgi:IMP cyclohydrolase